MGPVAVHEICGKVLSTGQAVDEGGICGLGGGEPPVVDYFDGLVGFEAARAHQHVDDLLVQVVKEPVELLPDGFGWLSAGDDLGGTLVGSDMLEVGLQA